MRELLCFVVSIEVQVDLRVSTISSPSGTAPAPDVSFFVHYDSRVWYSAVGCSV